MLINENENDAKEKIINLKKSFLLALNDFKQNYINYNLNDNVDEYQNIFFTSKSQLQELNSDLYDLTEKIKNKILTNHKKNQNEIKSLSESEELYNVTIDELKNASDKSRASNVLNDDYQDIYNEQFYKNFQLILGVIILSIVTYKMKNIKIKN
jgi:predicted methyltransferase